MHTAHAQYKMSAILTSLAVLIAGAAFLGNVQKSLASSDGESTTSSVDVSCMQTAVETREDGLASAWDTFNTDTKAALSARKSALSEAWGEADKKAQKKAVATAWKDWKKASKDAHTKMKKERKSVWDTFKKTSKESCKVTTPKDEVLGSDAAGTISL